ncbi:shugoshin [Trichoderma cornu-damae]|uniref:Shugoshin n=1 Tax=Trichoderma cornu-damae TaxID=654480 RepID=A0A9P8QKS9_9HYPO|nr:shugoshin [Trichoderma cornu-damae]
MARLNEMPVPAESLETLRKKMLRQNRELAKTNNIRALRIRELENECACMLSENLELRGRILELEKQVEDNEARRIADHAMAIKAKLESQLTEWGTLIAELGLEPPAKRHSPMVRRRSKQTTSFSASRPSPSQRRLRDLARDIEELGHISENKSYPRRSMNPEQILALRSEADISVESPELGPPPMSKYIEEDPVKVDSPTRSRPVRPNDGTSKNGPKAGRLEAPVTLASSKPERQSRTTSPSEEVEGDEKHQEHIARARGRSSKPKNDVETVPVQPLKAGSKRKFGARDDDENTHPQRVTDENSIGRILAEKTLLRDKTDGRVVKDFAKLRKKSQLEHSESIRKPLAVKSTNDDINSPMKSSKMKPSVADEIATAKANAAKSKAALERQGPRAKIPSSAEAEAEAVPLLTIEPRATPDAMRDLAVPVRESALSPPTSPAVAASLEGSRGDTPPPADISSSGEASRPSRRNRTTISYAEPNLRAKMRRPTKELFDAVAGEGKYARRVSNCDPVVPESAKSKREMAMLDSPEETDDAAASPLAIKHLAADLLLSSSVTERRKRTSSIASRGVEIASDTSMDTEITESTKDVSINLDSSGLTENDVYEFTSESPPPDKDEVKEVKRKGRRRTTTSRQSTMAVDEDDNISARERNNSRRRSMMV